MKYLLEVKVDFAAAHIVRGHLGKCARLHGHNWKVHVVVKSEILNDLGMGIDFADLKKIVHEVIDPLDHQYLNEIEPFTVINPTAEQVARFIYEEIEKKLSTNNLGSSLIVMQEVSLFETDNCKVTFFK
jgi:6-pyruvoyltetrahydropterin/6-carboxytetrahydropterin synthase